MKKLSVLILLAFMLCSCSEQAEKQTASDTEATETVVSSVLAEEASSAITSTVSISAALPETTAPESVIAFPEILHIDFDFNLNPADYESRIPIKYGSGSQKIIIYSDPEINRTPDNSWNKTLHVISNLSMFYCDNISNSQSLDLIFNIGYILPAEYYIEYCFDIPSENNSLAIEFTEYYGYSISPDIKHGYLLSFNDEGNAINLKTFEKKKKPQEILYGIYANTEIYSPSGKAALIGGLEGDDGCQQRIFVDDIQVVLNDDDIGVEYPQVCTKNAVWLDDNILLVVYGNAYGTVTRGGDIWYYDTRDGSKGLIISDNDGKGNYIEMNFPSFDGDNLVFNVYRHFNGFNDVFCAEYEKPISKNKLYDLINSGEVLRIDTEPIPEPAAANNTAIIKTSKTAAYEKPEFEYDWQELYYQELSSWFNYGPVIPNIPMFNIYDLDGNGVPELMISSGVFTMAECGIFTVENGELKNLGHYGISGKFIYDYERKYVCVRFRGQGADVLNIYKFENNEMVNVISFYSNAGMFREDVRKIYKIDDEEVTEDIYKAEREKYNYEDEITEEFQGHYDVNDYDAYIASGATTQYITYYINRDDFLSSNEVTEDVFYAEHEKYLSYTEGKFEVRRYFIDQRETLLALNNYNS